MSLEKSLKPFLEKWPRLWKGVQGIPLLSRTLNRTLITTAINKLPPRPEPLCCRWHYTTWEGLTNLRWNSRHLPPKELTFKNTPEEVAQTLFSREKPADDSSDGIRLSKKSTLLFPYFAQWFTDGFLVADMVDRRRNYSNHQIDLSQLYGLNPESTKLIREHKDGLLKSQMEGEAEFPPNLYNKKVGENELWDIDPQFRERRIKYNDFADIGNQPLHLDLPSPHTWPDPDEHDLKIPNKGGTYEGLNLGIPPHLLYNELPLSNSAQMFSDNRQDWFAMANDRANSTPGFVMMNLLMFREHNRIAREIKKSPDGKNWNDERIFQTTRNILTVIVIKIVIEEYINHITPYHFKLFADPGKFHKPASWKWTNWMTVEFDLLYRWHSMIPASLDLGGEPVGSFESLWNPGLIKKTGLAEMFNLTSKQVAGEIGAKNTWEWLVKGAESNMVRMGRDAEAASYNDYCELCGLPRKSSFSEISSLPNVQKALKELYEHPDDVEFVAGLFAEDLKPNAALGKLMGSMVASDAFSQAMTNPLLSKRVWKKETFGSYGWGLIQENQSIENLVSRNTPEYSGELNISMTRQDWKRT
ncbi:MAG: peroxidase family protein [Opitutaceae bacterium]